MRVFVASIMHETNTFTHGRTHLDNFRPIRGQVVYEHITRMQSSAVEGIINTLRTAGVEVVPSVFAHALPSGTVANEAYEHLKGSLLEDLTGAGELDGVCLALHGSMFAETCDDPEGDLLSAVRAIVGDEVPIVCALDMHATVTPKMCEFADGFTAYRTAPHVDEYETGQRAARILLETMTTGQPIVMEWISLPMMLCGEQSETQELPMRALLHELDEVEKRLDLLSISYTLAFPWADSPHMNVCVIAVGRHSQKDSVTEAARQLAHAFWDARHDFGYTMEASTLDECFSRALLDNRQPIIISDAGDNPTAGASQDLTMALKVAMDRNLRSTLFAIVADAASTTQCWLAGEDAEVSLQLGRISPTPGSPGLPIRAHILHLREDAGIRYALIDVEGITVITSDRRTAVYDPRILTVLGLKPEGFKIIVLKSGYMSPAYQAMAARKMLALTPGDTALDFSQLPYAKLNRPIFPLDPEVEAYIR